MYIQIPWAALHVSSVLPRCKSQNAGKEFIRRGKTKLILHVLNNKNAGNGFLRRGHPEKHKTKSNAAARAHRCIQNGN